MVYSHMKVWGLLKSGQYKDDIDCYVKYKYDWGGEIYNVNTESKYKNKSFSKNKKSL